MAILMKLLISLESRVYYKRALFKIAASYKLESRHFYTKPPNQINTVILRSEVQTIKIEFWCNFNLTLNAFRVNRLQKIEKIINKARNSVETFNS